MTLVTNFFRMGLNVDWTLYQYRVDFSPQLDSRRLRKDIMKAELQRLRVNDCTTFDGHMLFAVMRFQLDAGNLRL